MYKSIIYLHTMMDMYIDTILQRKSQSIASLQQFSLNLMTVLYIYIQQASARTITHLNQDQFIITDGLKINLFQNSKSNQNNQGPTLKLSVNADEQQITALSTCKNYILIAGNQSLELFDATVRICSVSLQKYKNIVPIKSIKFDSQEYVLTGSGTGAFFIWQFKQNQLKLKGHYQGPVSIDHFEIIERNEDNEDDQYSHPQFQIILSEQKPKCLYKWQCTNLQFQKVKFKPKDRLDIDYTCQIIKFQRSRRLFITIFSPGLILIWSSQHMAVIYKLIVRIQNQLSKKFQIQQSLEKPIAFRAFQIDSFCSVASMIRRGSTQLELYLIEWDLIQRKLANNEQMLDINQNENQQTMQTSRTATNKSIINSGRRKARQSGCCQIF